jgi:hypothetical protein
MATRKRSTSRSSVVGRAVSAGRRALREAEKRIPPDLRRQLQRRLKDADKTARAAVKQLQAQARKASTRADVNSVLKRIDGLTRQARQIATSRVSSTRRRATSTTRRAASTTRKAASSARRRASTTRKTATRKPTTRKPTTRKRATRKPAASKPAASKPATRATTPRRRTTSRRARPAATEMPMMPATPMTPEMGAVEMGSTES